jgi:hypothetical protein
MTADIEGLDDVPVIHSLIATENDSLIGVEGGDPREGSE